ncbi:MAG TPA: winged helix-turn-helix domain-containing protein [Bryobacteraceae bacterium]|nr:winged helix-turn-helix domain-containing protein [Bryobacteraceae bacterium]
MTDPREDSVLRFGAFELELRTGELRKGGALIKLQTQHFQLLALLAGRHGQMVSREEIRQALWKDDTFVDFDRSINFCVNKIREALGDDRQSPRFIETLPRRGYRFITPVLEAGDGVAEQTPAAEPALITKPARSTRRWLLGVAEGIALAAMVTAGVWWWRGSRVTPLRPLIRLEAAIPPETPLATNNDGGMLAISPDGTRLALTLRDTDGKIRVHTRLLRDNQLTPLAGTENAFSPFFSPDGQWIGFFADRKLKKIPFLGGGAVTLSDAPTPGGASWGDDGNIVFTASQIMGLTRVSDRGIPAPLINLKELARAGGRFPQVLPGSQAVLFTTRANGLAGENDSASIDVLSIKTGEIKTLQQGGYSGRYVVTPNGSARLIFARRGTLFAAPFNLRRMAVTSTPVPVLERVTSGGYGANFAFSSTGTFVYLAGEAQQGYSKIVWADSSGKVEPLEATPAGYFSPRFSPDGGRLAFSISRHDGSDLWVKALDRDAPLRLTFLDGDSAFPVWTPDGKKIIFKYKTAMSWIRSDGAGGPHPLTNGRETPRSISPDGKRLAYLHYADRDHPEIVTAAIEGDADHLKLGKPEVFLPARLGDSSPMFSPDGRWLAYMSTESGTAEIYVRPFPGPGGRWQISSGGGIFPVWSRDGRELLYQAPDQRLMAVSYTARRDSFSVGKPRAWSETRVMSPFGGVPGWDLAPDGKRVAGILEPAFGSITFLLNFFDELERRIPASGK